LQFVRWLTTVLPADAPVARRAHEVALELVEHVHLALSGFDPDIEVEAADRAAARLRALLRVALELGLISDGALLHGARLLEGIGRQLGGWQRYLRGDTR
ncbi:MAG TPA: hypothetical protein PKW90_26885, partial [Myxococcota bacterium]|nr:hypothetical protein [Myxococcota bacterium]